MKERFCMSNHSPQYLIDLARKMRKSPTVEEKLIWEALRDNKLGVKFRFQHILGRYIADFYCHSKKLVVEIDGKVHDIPDVIEYDRIRQAEIESRGLRVLRIRNEEIIEDLPRVILKIKQAINE